MSKTIMLAIYFFLTIHNTLSLYSVEISQEREALSKAIENKDSRLVQSLIETYAIPIDALSKDHNTPLMEAAYSGDLTSIRYLIAKGANVNVEHPEAVWSTPLKNALAIFWRKGDVLVAEMLRVFLEGGLWIHEKIESWRPSSFMEICKNNARLCAEILINAGIDINAQTREGKTALMFAIEERAYETAFLLIERQAHIELKDKEGRTVLFYAIAKKASSLVHLLIGAGANLQACDAKGCTLLMEAMKCGDEGLRKLFLEISPNVQALNHKKQSALAFVASTSDIQSAQILLDKGLKINQQDIEKGYTPFLEASRSNQTTMALFLADKGADFMAKDYEGINAVYHAAKNGNMDFLKFLISHQVPIETADAFGYTPLMEGIINNRINAVKYLLENGANQRARTRKGAKLFIGSKEYTIPSGTTALQLAQILQRKEMIGLLNP